MSLDRSELKLMLGALAGVCLSNFIIFSAPLYIGSLMDGMGFNETQAGLINTLEIGSVAVMCLLLSHWLSQFSLRYLAMAGALLILAANFVTFWCDEYLILLLLRVLAGLGAGLCLAATSALLSRMADPDRMMGMMLVINTLIMIVALTFMGYAKSQWNFAGVVGLFSVAVLILFPLLLLIPVESFSAGQTAKAGTASVDHHFSLGSLGVGLLFLFCVIEGGVWAFSERSGNNLGMGDGDIGMLLALAQTAGLIAALIPAVLGERIPRIFPICIGTLLMGSAGLLIYQTTSTLVYSACLCAFSFGFFIAFPYLVGACARLDADGRWAARASALNLLGGAVAPFIAANIISASDYQTLGTFCFGLSLVCVSLAVIFNRQLNRTEVVHVGQPG